VVVNLFVCDCLIEGRRGDISAPKHETHVFFCCRTVFSNLNMGAQVHPCIDAPFADNAPRVLGTICVDFMVRLLAGHSHTLRSFLSSGVALPYNKPRRCPGDTQETSRRHPKPPTSNQRAPRRHPGVSESENLKIMIC